MVSIAPEAGRAFITILIDGRADGVPVGRVDTKVSWTPSSNGFDAGRLLSLAEETTLTPSAARRRQTVHTTHADTLSKGTP
jgi:hypothetical protein